MRWWVSTVGMAGCLAQTGHVTDSPVPPPPELTLEASGLTSGGSVVLTARGANAGERVFFGGTAAGIGAGPCPPTLGGACLDIRAPVLLGTATANSAGVADFSTTAPSPLPTVWLQAAVARGAQSLVSNVASSDVRSPGAGDLVITEVMRNPDSVLDTDGEWFELHNPRSWDIDLTGVVIRDFGADAITLNSGVVPAGGYFVLGINADAATNGDVPVDLEWPGSFALSNNDDEIELVFSGVIIDTIAWGNAWPSTAGASMSLDPSITDNALPGGWCSGVTLFGSGDFGTPGMPNPSCGSITPGGCGSNVDLDDDGFFDCEDCDDMDARTHPGAPEVCDGLDNNCDGVLPSWDEDSDGDVLPDCDPCAFAGYRTPINQAGSSSSAIRNAIRGVTLQQTCSSYPSARDWMFVVLDKEPGGVVEDVYTGRRVVVGDQPPANGVMNTEHSWPQSQGTSSNPARCDLHHLFPVDSDANSERGSLPFGVVQFADWSRGGSMRGDNISGVEVFEPRDAHKGDVARAMLYMSIRHNLTMTSSQEALFQSWHAADPVDAWELRRTLIIEEEQGVANPFVVCPDVVSR